MDIVINGRVVFTEEELRCKGSGKLRLDPIFVEELKKLRSAFNEAMQAISCCRSAMHNAREGGAKQSFHICDSAENDGTCAIDIATPSAAYRTRLVKLALDMGWSVGVKKTMVHLDCRTACRQHPQVIFVY